MKRELLDILACPVCTGTLQLTATIGTSEDDRADRRGQHDVRGVQRDHLHRGPDPPVCCRRSSGTRSGCSLHILPWPDLAYPG